MLGRAHESVGMLNKFSRQINPAGLIKSFHGRLITVAFLGLSALAGAVKLVDIKIKGDKADTRMEYYKKIAEMGEELQPKAVRTGTFYENRTKDGGPLPSGEAPHFPQRTHVVQSNRMCESELSVEGCADVIKFGGHLCPSGTPLNDDNDNVYTFEIAFGGRPEDAVNIHIMSLGSADVQGYEIKAFDEEALQRFLRASKAAVDGYCSDSEERPENVAREDEILELLAEADREAQSGNIDSKASARLLVELLRSIVREHGVPEDMAVVPGRPAGAVAQRNNHADTPLAQTKPDLVADIGR